MGRRRQESTLDDVYNVLKITPIWVGPLLAVFAFVVFRFGIPMLMPPTEGPLDTGFVLRKIMPMLAWFVGGSVLLAWAAAEIHKLFNRRLLDSQSGLASIKDISWREFEQLVSEAYRRKGYVAEVVGRDGGDGGVDIRLTGHGETVLVQCKQWRTSKVGVTTVRELLGVVVSQRATRGVVVTSGRFTQEATAFARANAAIELVDGPALVELIRAVQATAVRQKPQEDQPRIQNDAVAAASPVCPLCSAGMVVRTARQGTNAGSQFWGCPKYPACRGTRRLEALEAGEKA